MTLRPLRLAAFWSLVVVILALLAWTRFFTRWPAIYYMTGGSMEPTIRARESFVALDGARLVRGQLALFRFEAEDGVFHVLRRLAALPGDTVAMEEGRLVVNGREQPWPFRIVEARARRSPLARGGDLYTWGPWLVPRDSVMLLADTRDMIGWPDSRFIGFVPAAHVIAEARRIVWSPDRRRILRRLR